MRLDFFNKSTLKRLLQEAHKFDDIPAKISERDNIFVLVDEGTGARAATWATTAWGHCPVRRISVSPAPP